MDVAIVTGSGGLIGAESVRFFSQQGFHVVGIDNDMRAEFFGAEASTSWSVAQLKEKIGSYTHYTDDIRDYDAMRRIFDTYGKDIKLVVHTAAQPSHDWAARAPRTDFGVNALGTLHLLECTREVCPEAVFIFTSTNKVYGDTPNYLPLVETETRWTIEPGHAYAEGIKEDMSIDQCTHSVFGASKVAADVMVQEYGRYFDMKTVCFRGGCLTGPGHSGAELHGFVAYLMKCCVIGRQYQIFGYKGKQVRDNIHSADLIQAFWQFYQAPRVAEVYNIGGGKYSNVSMMEAITMAEEITGKKMDTVYRDENRIGDHIWWIGNLGRFEEHYPEWKINYGIERIMQEVYEANVERAGA
ncbi:MAG: NAD-dependent epimerase/dehydratase family protein [Candidatus Hydrogenedens sp.]|nr:NAD-dependent epimerase/dehydratase family protein [Candidatus Hydrogenedens sp.]